MTIHRVREILWRAHKHHVRLACDLVHRGRHGIEAQILRDGGLFDTRLFPSREQAVAWAHQEKPTD